MSGKRRRRGKKSKLLKGEACGVTLPSATIYRAGHKQYRLIIVAVKKGSGKMIFNPEAGHIIEKGDHLIALGEDDDVNCLNRMCTSP